MPTETITAQNQNTPGFGRHYIMVGACPDLYNLTLPTEAEDERKLPIGWIIDSSMDANGKWVDIAISPSGQRWDLGKCGYAGSGSALQLGSVGMTLAVIGGAIGLYYLLRK